MHMIKLTMLALIAGFFAAACDTDGPAEEAGESLDNAVEDIGQSVEEAGEEIDEEIQ